MLKVCSKKTLLTHIDPQSSLNELKKDKPTTRPFSAVQSHFWTDGPLLSITTLNEGWNRTKSMHPSGTAHMHIKTAHRNCVDTLKLACERQTEKIVVKIKTAEAEMF